MSNIIDFKSAKEDEFEVCCKKIWDLLLSFCDEEISEKAEMTEEAFIFSCLTSTLGRVICQYYSDTSTRYHAFGVAAAEIIQHINESERDKLNE